MAQSARILPRPVKTGQLVVFWLQHVPHPSLGVPANRVAFLGSHRSIAAPGNHTLKRLGLAHPTGVCSVRVGTDGENILGKQNRAQGLAVLPPSCALQQTARRGVTG